MRVLPVDEKYEMEKQMSGTSKLSEYLQRSYSVAAWRFRNEAG
jgi:hypothetical protein